MERKNIFILTPNEAVSSTLKSELREYGFDVYTQFDGRSEKTKSYQAVLSFYRDSMAEAAGHGVYRAIYLSHNEDPKDRLCVQRDGLYNWEQPENAKANVSKMISYIDRICQHGELQQERVKTEAGNDVGAIALSKIVGKSHAIRNVKARIRQLSQVQTMTIMITGETGTGKELIADALHACSPRAEGPLVKLNCAAIPENLFESHLFGHRKGAFSGAFQSQKGLVAQAEGGTLFLDEISCLKPEQQAKLLRFLEDGSYLPVGEGKERKSNARVIAASNQNLRQLAEEDSFRSDLYYRLMLAPLDIPPLRQRGSDVLYLTRHFLQRFAAELGTHPKHLSAESETLLMGHDWPGNVRELRNTIRELCMKNDKGLVRPEHFRLANLSLEPFSTAQPEVLTLEEVQRRHIKRVYEMTHRNKSETSRLLGISLNTLKGKLGYL